MSSAKCGAAQAAEEQQAAQLPDELVELVVARLPRSVQPAARLVSKAFEAAVAVRAVRLHEWPGSASSDQPPRVRPSLQRHLERVEASGHRGLTEAHWQLLGELASQLPALRWLCISGYGASVVPAPVAAAFSRLVRLDLPIYDRLLPEGVSLPALRVASFRSADGLSRINALAPQLRQLELARLGLPRGFDKRGSLPHVTHFSGHVVEVFDADNAEGVGVGDTVQAVGAALAAALPALEVFVSLPKVFLLNCCVRVHLAELLAVLPSLRAVRARASDLQLDEAASQAALSRLRHLLLHERRGFWHCTGAVCSWLSAAAPHLSGLQHVVLALRLQGLRATADGSSHALQLLRVLAGLPALQSLVLPDSALCSKCCASAGGSGGGIADLHAALAALACSPSLTRLEFAEIAGCDCACAHPPQRAEGRATVSAAAAARAAPLALCFGQRHEVGAGLQDDAFGALAGGVFAAPVDEGSVWGELGPRAGQL